MDTPPPLFSSRRLPTTLLSSEPWISTPGPLAPRIWLSSTRVPCDRSIQIP
jgi:hypothetical protein